MTKISDVVLFACAGLHLSGGTILGGSAAWGFFKLSYYFWTTELASELSFSVVVFAASLLSLPVSWLATVVPYHRKSYALPAALMCLSTAALVLFALSLQATAGLSRSLRDPADLNASMLRAMQRDALDLNARSAFATMQLELRCCGVQSFRDWHAHRPTLPPSCCGLNEDTKGGPVCVTVDPLYVPGCLKPALAELRVFNNSTSFVCGILVISMALTLLTAGCQLTSSILEKEKPTKTPCPNLTAPFALLTPPALLAHPARPVV